MKNLMYKAIAGEDVKNVLNLLTKGDELKSYFKKNLSLKEQQLRTLFDGLIDKLEDGDVFEQKMASEIEENLDSILDLENISVDVVAGRLYETAFRYHPISISLRVLKALGNKDEVEKAFGDVDLSTKEVRERIVEQIVQHADAEDKKVLFQCIGGFVYGVDISPYWEMFAHKEVERTKKRDLSRYEELKTYVLKAEALKGKISDRIDDCKLEMEIIAKKYSPKKQEEQEKEKEQTQEEPVQEEQTQTPQAQENAEQPETTEEEPKLFGDDSVESDELEHGDIEANVQHLFEELTETEEEEGRTA